MTKNGKRRMVPIQRPLHHPTPVEVREVREALIARIAKQCGISMAELRRALDRQWECRFEPLNHRFRWRTLDGSFATTIEADKTLLDFVGRKKLDPNDVSSELAFPFVLAASGVAAAAALVLRSRNEPLPEKVIP